MLHSYDITPRCRRETVNKWGGKEVSSLGSDHEANEIGRHLSMTLKSCVREFVRTYA